MWFSGAGLLLLSALFVAAQVLSAGRVLTTLRLEILPLLLAATAAAYALRFAKWNYLVQIAAGPVGWRDSLVVFLSGMSMAITPAKVGELIKAYLMHRLNGTPPSQGVSLVVVERGTDLIALVLLAAAGATVFRRGLPVLLFVVLALSAGLWVLLHPPMVETFLRTLEHIGALRRPAASVRATYRAARPLLTGRSLLASTALGVCAWGFECLTLYLVFHGMGVPQGFLVSIFVFSFSTAAGALSMLPGGLGVAEGNLTAWMVWLRLPLSLATAATVMIRLTTLWFGVLLGVVTLAWHRKLFFPQPQEVCR